MKMSTAWHGFRNHSPSNYFAAAAALGIEYVEVPMYSHGLSTWFGPVFTDDVRRLAETCGVRMVTGVAALELAAPFDELGRPITEDVAEYNRVHGLRLIDLAVDLGLDVVRVAEPDIKPEKQHFAEKYIDDFGLALRSIADHGEAKGIVVAVENYGLDSDQMVALLDAGDHDNLGTLFDPCNYARMGEDPLSALLKLKDRVVYCHLKDTRNDEERPRDELFPGSRWQPSVAVGDGDIDWAPLLDALSSIYSGYASIEYEDADDVILGTRRSLDFVAATLQSLDRASLSQ